MGTQVTSGHNGGTGQGDMFTSRGTPQLEATTRGWGGKGGPPQSLEGLRPADTRSQALGSGPGWCFRPPAVVPVTQPWETGASPRGLVWVHSNM